ncbi:MAG: TPM domain-containing protein [Acidobacteriia bacterium]|nr:TPM domain-containing protein [Terriglobia bacterium]
MKKYKLKFWHAGILAVFLMLPVLSAGEKIPYSPTGYVNDFAGMMSAATRERIEQIASGLNQQGIAELSVVTVPSIGDRSEEDYATDLFAQWGIGKKGKDNGLLLLVAKNEKKIRIEAGYGLEDKVPDAIANEIYSTIRDHFRQGDFDGGLLTGAQMLASAAGGTFQTPAPASRPYSRPRIPGFFIVVLVFIFFSVLRGAARAATGRPAVRAGSSFPWWLLLFLNSGGRGGSSWGGGGFSGGGGGFGGFGGGMSGGGGAGGGW